MVQGLGGMREKTPSLGAKRVRCAAGAWIPTSTRNHVSTGPSQSKAARGARQPRAFMCRGERASGRSGVGAIGPEPLLLSTTSAKELSLFFIRRRLPTFFQTVKTLRQLAVVRALGAGRDGAMTSARTLA